MRAAHDMVRPDAVPSYAQVVAAMRVLVDSVVPAGAVVAVVNKGDSELLRFVSCRGVHFPQAASGEYAGHHPADGGDAVRHLRLARARGATHIAIPVTSAWWLEHYGEFREHLARTADLLADEPGVGMVFALDVVGAGSATNSVADIAPPVDLAGAMVPTGTADIEQLTGLLDNLLPEDCTVAVATMADAPWPELPGRTQVPWSFDDGQGVRLVEEFRALRQGGADYLVVPAALDAALHRTGVAAQLSRCRRVAHHRHVCTVFDLRGAPAVDCD